MRAAEFINESPELAEKYKAHLIKTLPLLMNFLSKTSKEYLPTEDEMLNVIETGYEVMLQSGDKNKAGEAVRNKLKSLISKQSVTESLYVDVPNENWLQDKIDYAKSKGRDRWGAPFFNSTTASFREQNVRVPIEILRRLPGMRNEQKNVRTKDLIAIKKIMKDTGKLPMHNNKEYVPFIMVAYNGEAWVNEGNHRIMAAAELFDEGDKRFAELPIELKYFDGGERVKSGVLSPEKIGNQGVMEGSYREGGSITHDGVEYDFDSVMSIAEKMPTKTCSVDKLSWVLQYDTPNKERLERADITVPLIVTKSVNGKLAAIDGLHRLAKAVRDNVKTLPVKYIKPSELESAKLNKQGVAENSENNHLSQITNQLTENRITLQDLYNGNFPERYELFWDYVRSGDLHTPLEVKTLPKYKLEIILRDQYRVEHLDEILDMMNKYQKDILQRYMNDGDLSKKIIVISGDRIIDGNHRALAAAMKGVSMQYIDLAELDEQDMSEDWSEKYKRSINCNNPRGFSQRAHCQGRKKRGKSK